MCTLTYWPTEHGFIFTHSRDELKRRPASSTWQQGSSQGQSLYFPQDLQAGGTWFAVDQNGRSACLLNGGDTPYLGLPQYPHSRGEVIFRALAAPQFATFAQKTKWQGFEPFTLLLHDTEKLWRLVHNPASSQLYAEDHHSPGIWSSTKLYTGEQRAQRQAQWERWRQKKDSINAEALRHFHLHGDAELALPGFRLKMSGGLETVSLTQVEVKPKSAYLYYHPLTAKPSVQKITWQ